MKRKSTRLLRNIACTTAAIIASGGFAACGSKTKDLSVSIDGAENGVINAVYSGSPIAVKAVTDVTLSYQYEGIDGTNYTASATAPTDAGSYKVSVSFEGNDTYKAYNTSVKLIIAKAENDFTVSMNGYVYGEEASEPIVTGNKGGDVSFTYTGTGDTEYAATNVAPTDAGAYKVTAEASETTNYLVGSAETSFTVHAPRANSKLPWRTILQMRRTLNRWW